MIVILEEVRVLIFDFFELGELLDQLFVTILRFNQPEDVQRLHLIEKLQDSLQENLAVIAWPRDDSGA
jgi:hypothetical protein